MRGGVVREHGSEWEGCSGAVRERGSEWEGYSGVGGGERAWI